MRVVTTHAVCAPFVALRSFTVFFKSPSKFLHPNVFICLKIRHVADYEYFAPSVFVLIYKYAGTGSGHLLLHVRATNFPIICHVWFFVSLHVFISAIK